MLPATRSRSDGALDAALERIGGRDLDRPDTPDLHVTAVRRLPPVPAQLRAVSGRARSAAARGARVARHRAALHPPGGGDRPRARAAATSSSSRRPRRARRSATTRRCSTRSCRIPSSRALYLFPTKALAQDQLAELQAMCETIDAASRRTRSASSPTTATRRRTRGARSASRAHLVLSNPDMVHSGILPHHPRWAKLFENLRYVDHRRAARLSRRVRQPSVQRAAAAAADLPALRIGSGVPLLVGDDREPARAGRAADRAAVRAGRPERRAARREVLRVRQSAGRQPSARHPPLVSRARRGGSPSEFLKRNLQLIVFAQSRLATEILTTYLKDDFEGVPGAPERIRGYRGGYLPNRRREIEKGLREGAVRAVVSTNALELGIDIGALDVCGDGRLSGHDRRDLAARRPRRAAREPIGGGDGGEQRAARSVHRAQPVVLLRRVARARADRSRQPAHPGRSRQVRGVRAAVRARPRRSAAHDRAGNSRRCSPSRDWSIVRSGDDSTTGGPGRGPGPTSRIRPTRSACGRCRRTTSSSSTRRTRRGSSAKPISPAARRRSTPRRSTSSRAQLYQVERLDFDGRKAFVREIDCDYYTDAITYTRVTILDTFAEVDARAEGAVGREQPASGGRRVAIARRGPRRFARRRLQEDQVLHQRERRLGRARSARAADAHDVVLADDSGGGDGGAAVRRPTIGATASSAWRSRCGRSRSCC